jgi:uncharacterized protein with HEPN domain
VTKRSITLRLQDILEVAENIYAEVQDITLDAFESDWRKRYIVERGIEIISEASRHLPEELKARHPEIPWKNVAGIGNRLRHEYQRVAPDTIWGVAREHTLPLKKACREELALLSGKTR